MSIKILFSVIALPNHNKDDPKRAQLLNNKYYC